MTTAFDYSGILNTATTRIDQFGRAMTLTRASRVPAGSKPWLTQQGATTASGAQSIAVFGVQTVLDRRNRDEQTVELKVGQFLIRADPELPEEVGRDWELVDGARTYTVIQSSPLQPGGTLLLYKLSVVL